MGGKETRRFLGNPGKGYIVDCSKVASLPNLDITLGGHSFTLTANDYVLQMLGQCLFAFVGIDIPAPRGPLWIMGDVFMRKYYCVFDYGNKQMQIAPAPSSSMQGISKPLPFTASGGLPALLCMMAAAFAILLIGSIRISRQHPTPGSSVSLTTPMLAAEVPR